MHQVQAKVQKHKHRKFSARQAASLSIDDIKILCVGLHRLDPELLTPYPELLELGRKRPVPTDG